MTAQLKAGVIGLGLLGSGYVNLFRDQPEIKLTAVADLRADKAQEVGAQIGAQPYTNYLDMLKEHKLDVVAVATPDHLHKEPVLAAIRAGVPTVIQEKPMATTVADAEEMLEVAEKAKTRIFIAYANRGSSPLDGATYYVIHQGLLGEIIHGEIQVDDHISVPTRMWGARSKEWAGGSSSAHFLLSHVVDYLRWLMAPAEITQVYAISQQKVLGYTPDLYDAFLTFSNGAKFRAKGGWIKHIDGVVEFTLSFTGSEGTLNYIKIPGFGQVEGWRANVSDRISPEEVLAHQQTLSDQGINVRTLLHRSAIRSPWMGDNKELRRSLEAFVLPGNWWRLAHCFLDSILEDTLTPSSWNQYGPLPTGIDGLRQTQVVCAIVESAKTGRVIDLER